MPFSLTNGFEGVGFMEKLNNHYFGKREGDGKRGLTKQLQDNYLFFSIKENFSNLAFSITMQIL